MNILSVGVLFWLGIAHVTSANANDKSDMAAILGHLESQTNEYTQQIIRPDPSRKIDTRAFDIIATWVKWISKDYIVSTSPQKDLVIWNVSTGKPIRFLERIESSHSFRVLAVSADGKYVASGIGKNNNRVSVRIWNPLDGVIVKDITAPKEFHQYLVHSIAFSPDNRYMVVMFSPERGRYDVNAHHYVIRYAVNDWAENSRLRRDGTPYWCPSVQVSADGELAACVGEQFRIRKSTFDIYNFKTGKVVEVPPRNLSIAPYRFAFDVTDNNIWISGSIRNKGFYIGALSHESLNVDSAVRTNYLPFSKVEQLLATKQRDLLILSGDNGLIELRNKQSGSILASFMNDGKPPYSIDYEQTTNALLAANGESINIYNLDEIMTNSAKNDLPNTQYQPVKQLIDELDRLSEPTDHPGKILKALKEGDINSLKILLADSANIDMRLDPHGNTPLLLCVHKPSIKHHENILAFLFAKGANLEARDKRGNTPLLNAIAARNHMAVRLLIEHGVDMKAGNYYGTTPISFAAGFGDAELVKTILGSRVSIDYQIRGKDGNNGPTALMMAAAYGRYDTVEYLLKAGARLDARDHRGRTVKDIVNEVNNKKMKTLFEKFN